MDSIYKLVSASVSKYPAVPLAEGHRQNLPSTQTPEKVEVSSMKTWHTPLKLRNSSPPSPQDQQPAFLAAGMPHSKYHIHLKESVKKFLLIFLL